MTDNRRQNPQIEQVILELRDGLDVEQNFRRVFDFYYSPLQKFFQRRSFSPEDAHELTQETFFRVFNKIEQFRGAAPFEAWLWQIAQNLYRKRLAAQETGKRAGATVSLDDETTANYFLPDARQKSALDDILQDEQTAQLRRAISELPEQMRKCISLRVFQDLSYQEIAVVMQISAQTVKAHLFQARSRLQKRLGAYFENVEI